MHLAEADPETLLLFLVIVNDWRVLIIDTKSFTLDVPGFIWSILDVLLDLNEIYAKQNY